MVGEGWTAAKLAGYIDHTCLKPEDRAASITRLCEEAVRYGFATVCLHPCFVARATELLGEHPSKVCTVAGFPFGTNHSKAKAQEAAQAIADGADEVDMVINIPAALDGDMVYLARDVEGVLEVCRGAEREVVLKVILETALFDREKKVALCRLMANLGVDFIKTSTGMHAAGGATVEDVRLMAEHKGGCKIKAAGGIRDLETCLAMIEAGADRIGASAGVAIIEALTKE